LRQDIKTGARSSSALHFSSQSDEWPTPKAFFEQLNERFRFTLDPCATDQNAKCKRYFTRKENGLLQDWSGHTVFMNPPYGREIGLWMEKAFNSSHRGATVVCLVPARTDTKWWHAYAMRGEISFLKGRLKFGNASASAPFPSAIVIFRPSSTTKGRRGTKGMEGDSPSQSFLPFI
jgi:site-specific DNA-methyltransferase (adenine-specific)